MRQPRIFHLIQRAHSALFRASDKALKHHVDLTASQQGVLYVLVNNDGASISTIADTLCMGKSSLTGLVDRMEASGLVRRRQSSSDARSYHVFIEDKGRKIVEATLPVTRRINAALIEQFSAHDRAVIERFLEHVAEQGDTIVSTHAKRVFRNPSLRKTG